MVLLSGLEKSEQGLKLNLKNSLKIDTHIIKLLQFTQIFCKVMQVFPCLYSICVLSIKFIYIF